MLTRLEQKVYVCVPEQRKHRNIKTCPQNPSVRIPPSNCFLWGFFSWKIKEKRPPHIEKLGLSQIFMLGTPSRLYVGIIYVVFCLELANFTRNSLKNLSFPEILRVQDLSKISKNDSQGDLFITTSCQRVCFCAFCTL